MRTILAAAALLLAAFPSRADGWAFRSAPAGGTSAGYALDGGAYAGLWLDCAAGGGARLSIATGGAALQPGVDQTAVVTVDGTAFLQRMRAGVANGAPVLQRTVPAGEVGPLAETLAKGGKAEVSMPAGRFALPLKGSGRALARFLAACR